MPGEERSKLWEKCMLGKVEEVRKALEEGADPNTTDGEREITCLMVALEKNQAKVVDLLISCPAIEVNAKDPINRTALHFACWKGNVAMLSKLLAIPGLLLNERMDRGRTPIMAAVKFGRPDAVRLMAAVSEVDLDVKDNDGNNLEQYAAR